jgi:hypothetical protein
VQRFDVKGARHDGDHLIFTHTFANVRKSFYVRVRGTNRDVSDPELDSITVDPWDDLWFYSNPVMIRTKRA